MSVRSRWDAPRPGSVVRQDLLAPPTVGRTSRTTSNSQRHTFARKMATSPSPAKLIFKCAAENLFWPWALSEAGQQVRSSLFEPYQDLRAQYVRHWKHWQSGLLKLDEPPRERDLYRTSVAVLRSHESKDFLGGVIASLSIPWGFNKGDEDLGGYHLIWPRDLVETAFGFLAAGAQSDAVRVLH